MHPQFDNDNANIPLTGTDPINEYLDIFWNGMSLVNTAQVAGLNPGIPPNSPPNYAAYSAGKCFPHQPTSAAAQRLANFTTFY